NLGPWIVWMRDNRHVVFFREAAGDENWRAWRADLETGDVRPLTPGPGVTCYVQQHSCHFPSELLIAHNARDKRHFDIYRINVATGESALLQLNRLSTTISPISSSGCASRYATLTTAVLSICSMGPTTSGCPSARSVQRTR